MADQRNEGFAWFIGQHVKSSGRTLEQIADVAGYRDPEQVRRILDGEKRMPMDRIPDFARALKVHPSVVASLVVEADMPEVAQLLEKFGGDFLTDNEREMVAAYRDAATYDEVRVTRPLRRRIEALIAENKPPRRRPR